MLLGSIAAVAELAARRSRPSRLTGGVVVDRAGVTRAGRDRARLRQPAHQPGHQQRRGQRRGRADRRRCVPSTGPRPSASAQVCARAGGDRLAPAAAPSSATAVGCRVLDRPARRRAGPRRRGPSTRRSPSSSSAQVCASPAVNDFGGRPSSERHRRPVRPVAEGAVAELAVDVQAEAEHGGRDGRADAGVGGRRRRPRTGRHRPPVPTRSMAVGTVMTMSIPASATELARGAPSPSTRSCRVRRDRAGVRAPGGDARRLQGRRCASARARRSSDPSPSWPLPFAPQQNSAFAPVRCRRRVRAGVRAAGGERARRARGRAPERASRGRCRRRCAS